MKSLRDLRSGWLSFTACGLTICLALCLFLAFVSASRNLESSCNETYQRLNFLDFYVKTRDAPRSVVNRVAALPGIEAVEARLRLGAQFLLDPLNIAPSRSRRIQGSLIGLPWETQPSVNSLHLEQGRYLGARRGEILLERRFSTQHGFAIGDAIRVEHWGRNARFEVVGIVSSPEYIWLSNNRFDPRPAFRRFGVGYVSNADAEALTQPALANNELHVRLASPQDSELMMERVGRELADFAVGPAVPRSEQASNAHLLRDRRAFAAVATIFPIVFLALSALILFSTMWQLVTRQRRQIGVMMAQGFSSLQLIGHFLLVGGLVGAFGGLAGAVAGVMLGEQCTRFYARILGLPFVEARVHWGVLLAALLVVMVISLSAAWLAAGRILSLNPIQAIRADFVTHRGGLSHSFRLKLPVPLVMAARNLLRHPGRAAVSIFGVAFSVAQIVMTLALFESQSNTVEFYFNRAHLYDLQAQVSGRRSRSELPPLEHWPGVESVETYLRLRATIRLNSKELQTMVWGVPDQPEQMKFFGPKLSALSPSQPDNLYLGPPMMRRLGARHGDIVTMEIDRTLPGAVQTVLRVVELHEPLANPPKMGIDQLRRLGAATYFLPDQAVDLVLIQVAPGSEESVKRRLVADPSFSGVIGVSQIRDEIMNLLRVVNAYKSVMLVFTSLFAFVVLLATTTMNVLERTRDLATLSCLGVGDATLALILILETLGLWCLSLFLGIPAGYYLGGWLVNNFQSELLQLQLLLSPESVVATCLFSLIICTLAVFASLVRIGRIPLTQATQDRLD